MPKRPSRLRDRSWWWWKFVSPKYELHGGSGINCQARGRCYLPSLCYVFPLYRMTFMYQERNLLCSISFCLRTPLLLFALRKSLMNCFHNWHLASCGVCECGFVVVLVLVCFFCLPMLAAKTSLMNCAFTTGSSTISFSSLAIQASRAAVQVFFDSSSL